MKKMFTLFVLVILACHADAREAESDSFTLFRPVPRNLMRTEMSTDRPDVTESPHTVDAGHIQYESDLVRFTREHKEGNKASRQFLVDPFMLKVGLTGSIDFQLSFQAYRYEQHKDNGSSTHYGNMGSVSLRLKKNLFGNDDGALALALLPYVKLPTHSYFEHHKLEAGLIVPAEWTISGKWSVGVQEELDWLAEEEDYQARLLQSLVVKYELVKQLDLLAETYCEYEFSDKKYEQYINIALQYNMGKNLAFDAGFTNGIQKDTEHHYYMGIAWRW